MKGSTTQARWLYREDVDFRDKNRSSLKANEAERNEIVAAQADTLAVIIALDPSAWRVVRLTLSSSRPDPFKPGVVYEMFHLGRQRQSVMVPAMHVVTAPPTQISDSSFSTCTRPARPKTEPWLTT